MVSYYNLKPPVAEEGESVELRFIPGQSEKIYLPKQYPNWPAEIVFFHIHFLFLQD